MTKTRQRLVLGAAAVLVAAAGIVLGVVATRTPPVCTGVPAFTSGTATAPSVYNETGKTITLTTCPEVLRNLSDVIVNGGTWVDPNKDPGRPYGGTTAHGRAGVQVIGGTGITLENMTMRGADSTGNYIFKLAFNAGIEIEGTQGVTLTNDTVSHVFGDCLELAPLRGPPDGEGGIIGAVAGVTASNLNLSACGRQGISPINVRKATFTGITVGRAGFDSMDDEADQSHGEGAKAIVFNAPCTFAGAISVSSGGESSGPITFNGCTINETQDGGEALYVKNLDGSPPAGPITFSNTQIRCGASAYVPCLNVTTGGDIILENSALRIGNPSEPAIRERAYRLGGTSTLTIVNTTVRGIYNPGIADAQSTVTGALVPPK